MDDLKTNRSWLKKTTGVLVLGLLCAISLWGFVIVGYLDMSLMSAPANPAAGYLRIWSDNGSTLVQCKTSAGAACFFQAAGGSTVNIQTNGVANSLQTTLNLQSSGSTTVTNTSGGNVTIAGPSFSVGGTPTTSQTAINFVAGSGVTITNPTAGNINIASSGSGVTFQTNGVNNGSQALLNLKAGTNVTLTDNGSGQITIDASGGGASITLQTNGVNNGSQTILNLAAGTGIGLSDNGTGTVTVSNTSASGATRGIGIAFGVSGGTALTATQTQYVTIPFSCDIVGWNLTVDAGTATVDVWKKAAGPADWSGLSGTVNTAGTAVTWVSGSTFPTDAAGRTITINSVLYEIVSVGSSTALTLKTTAGTQTGVAYASPGTAVPTVTNKIDGSSLPAIASGTFSGSTNLSGWTTGNTGIHVIKNDVFGFNLNAVSGVSALSLVMECQQ